MSDVEENFLSFARSNWKEGLGAGFAALCFGFPLLRAYRITTLLRRGTLASCKDYSKSAYIADLAPTLPDNAGMMLIVGTEGVGKSFAASHLGEQRKNGLSGNVVAVLATPTIYVPPMASAP